MASTVHCFILKSVDQFRFQTADTKAETNYEEKRAPTPQDLQPEDTKNTILNLYSYCFACLYSCLHLLKVV